MKNKIKYIIIASLLILPFVAQNQAGAANASVIKPNYACAIQKPSTPMRIVKHIEGSVQTRCRETVRHLRLVICLVRYNSDDVSSFPNSRACEASDGIGVSSLIGRIRYLCNYTTYLYSWRVTAYAVATLKNGQIYISPSVRSNPIGLHCN